MYECESWTIKRAEHRRIDIFELWCWRKLFESALNCEEIKPVNPKGNQSWIFIGRTDAEDETPILWPPDVKNWLIGKDPDAGKGWRQKKKGTTRWDGWMASLTRWTWVWVNSGMEREAWCAAVHGVTKSPTWLSDSTELNWGCMYSKKLSTLCDFRHRGVLEHMILS